jgi:hypothetical protein
MITSFVDWKNSSVVIRRRAAPGLRDCRTLEVRRCGEQRQSFHRSAGRGDIGARRWWGGNRRRSGTPPPTLQHRSPSGVAARMEADGGNPPMVPASVAFSA